MKVNKKLKLPIIAACAALSLGIGYMAGTSAYFTDAGSVTNEMSTGHNTTEIVETFTPPKTIPKNSETPYTKDVTIKNTGTVPCYVRVFLDFSDQTARDSSVVSGDGTNYYSMADYASHLPSGWAYVSTGNLAGYYYYTNILNPGETTNSLLKSVKTTLSNYESQNDFDILVHEELVQSDKADGSGSQAYDAAWKEFLTR